MTWFLSCGRCGRAVISRVRPCRAPCCPGRAGAASSRGRRSRGPPWWPVTGSHRRAADRSAALNERASWNRSSRSLARAVASTASSARAARDGGCWPARAARGRAGRRRRPGRRRRTAAVRSAARRAGSPRSRGRCGRPRPHRAPARGRGTTGVPRNAWTWVTVALGAVRPREIPKSTTLTAPSGVIITLAGLMSRWTTPARWLDLSAERSPDLVLDRVR